MYLPSLAQLDAAAAIVYRAMAPFFGRLPGGLLHTNIAVCTIFGAVSGSSMSVAAAVGWQVRQADVLLACDMVVGASPVLDVPGVEADDVIATLATRAAEAGIDVIFLTADVNVLQMIEQRRTLIPWHVGGFIDHVIAIERGDRNEGDVNDVAQT